MVTTKRVAAMVLAALLGAGGVTLLGLDLFAFGVLQQPVERYLSPDASLSAAMRTRLRWLVAYVALLSAGLGWALRAAQASTWGTRLKTAFFKDLRSTAGPAPAVVLIVTLVVGVAVSTLFLIYYRTQPPALRPLFVEDGVFETLTALVFALGAAAWLRVALKPGPRRGTHSPSLKLGAFAVALAFAFAALEEISWGQRLFGWSTPAFLAQANAQGETSVHNLDPLSGLFAFLYLLPALLPLVVAWAVFVHLRAPESVLAGLLPHPALLPLAILIGAVALSVQGELLEELSALFAIFYTWRTVPVLTHLLKETGTKPNESYKRGKHGLLQGDAHA